MCANKKDLIFSLKLIRRKLVENVSLVGGITTSELWLEIDS